MKRLISAVLLSAAVAMPTMAQKQKTAYEITGSLVGSEMCIRDS